METKDWVQACSILALIIGWFVNGYLNRKNDIAKKRLEYRLPTLQSYLKIWYIFNDPQSGQKINFSEYRKLVVESRENFQLYGSRSEIALFEEFIKYGTDASGNNEKAKRALEKLTELIRLQIRKELRIK